MFYDDRSDYIGLLPELWQDLAEIKALADVINPQLDKLLSEIKRDVDNKFPATADADGIARWETILGISAPLNSSLQARRDAVRAKLMTKPPINMQTLKTIVEAYMGLTVDIEETADYTLTIWYRGESRVPDLNPLYVTIYDTIPANMIVNILYRYLIWRELDVQELIFTGLDALAMDWITFERGTWIV